MLLFGNSAAGGINDADADKKKDFTLSMNRILPIEVLRTDYSDSD